MSDFSPWDAIRAAKAALLEAREPQKPHEYEWQISWKPKHKSAEDVMELGKMLSAHRCGFWLDFLEVSHARRAFVLEKNLLPGKQFDQFLYGNFVIAVQMLKFAFLGEWELVKQEWRRSFTHNCYSSLSWAINRLEIKLDLWFRGSHPPRTAYMSRTELYRALQRGRMQKFGARSQVPKMIQRSEIEEDTAPVKDGRTRYAKFRHLDDARQFEIAKLTATYLKKHGKNVCFSSPPLWTAEPGTQCS